MLTQKMEPPSYEEASNECRVMPLIFQMHHHAPGRFVDDEKHLMTAGRLIDAQGDAILLPTTVSYEQVLQLLQQRVLARAGCVAVWKEYRFFCRLAIVVGEQLVLLNKGSWVAARELLRYRDDVDLGFVFSVVARGYTGEGVVEFWKRKLGIGGEEKICLVELSGPVLAAR